jgi:hypothetical protein
MQRKAISLLLILGLTALVAACGGASNEIEDSDGPTQTQPVEDEDDDRQDQEDDNDDEDDG